VRIRENRKWKIEKRNLTQRDAEGVEIRGGSILPQSAQRKRRREEVASDE
jgi:hypothetical protein